MPDTRRLILASGSSSRRAMLASAGVEFGVVPADVDEYAIRDAMKGEDGYANPTEVAATLAREKAVVVSRRYPKNLVIGADQTLSLGLEIFDKATSLEEARERLEMLNGQTHELHSAVALAEGGVIAWEYMGTASLTMRRMSQSFLDTYMQSAGRALMSSVGAYELEGLGVQMFEHINGDYFTILGLPLLPLLGELRHRGAIQS